MDLGNLSRPTGAGWVPRGLEWSVGLCLCPPNTREQETDSVREKAESGLQSSEALRRKIKTGVYVSLGRETCRGKAVCVCGSSPVA